MKNELIEAILYDWHNDNLLGRQNRDIKFYLDFVNNKKFKKILVVGAGTGRVAIPLSKKSNITALDLSLGRLLELNFKKGDIPIICESIVDYRSPQKYDLVIVPYATIQNINPKDWEATINSIYLLLNTGGSCLIDYNDSFVNASSTEKVLECESCSKRLKETIKEYDTVYRLKNCIKVIREYYVKENIIYKAVEHWYIFNMSLFKSYIKNKFDIINIVNGYQHKNYDYKKIIVLKKK